MKKNMKHTFLAGLAMLSILSIVLIFSCKKEAIQSLGSVPVASFTATVNSDGHDVTLLNTTPGVTISPYWSAPGLNLGYSDLQGDTVHLNFTFPNTYVVKMLVAGKGGLDSLSQNVTTTQPDPNACNPNLPLGFIASCTQKTWKLNPYPGAIGCGDGPGLMDWWANGTADVIARPCTFNDTYTFKFDAAGDYIFDDGGDFYAEDYSGNPQWTCRSSSTYPANQVNWASGNFNYAVIAGTGVKGLGQLKVIGMGAHIGLNKPINGSAPGNSFATSVTYDIFNMQQNISDATGNYDLLTLTLTYQPGGWWTYVLRSDH